jgi:predicted transcriptional regulator YheO
MKKFENKEFYERIDQMIKMKMTGTPNEFACKLGISESHLYRIINYLKERASCPIFFDKSRNSYVYEFAGKLEIKFCYEIDKKEQQKIKGGMCFNFNRNSLSKIESGVNYFWFDNLFFNLKIV